MNITKEILKTMVLSLLTSACSAREAKTVIDTPAMPESPPATWLTYHLAHPEAEETATAGDPNPAFFWKGRYHLHYIYKHQTGSVFGHVSRRRSVLRPYLRRLGSTSQNHEHNRVHVPAPVRSSAAL